jgi:O-antigen ligase
MGRHKSSRFTWLKNEELISSVFCIGIATTLIFWPLLNSILCLLFAVYWLLFAKKNVAYKKKYWITLFCSLYLVVLFGTVHSDNIKEAISDLRQKAAFILFPIILGTSTCINETVYRRSFTALTIATITGSIFCIAKGGYNYFKTGIIENLYGYELLNGLKDMTPFIMSLCCLLCLLYLCHHIYLAKKETKPVFIPAAYSRIAAIVFLFLFLLVVGNRNILFLATAVLVFYSFKLSKKKSVRVAILMSVSVIIIIAIKSNPHLKRQWSELTNISKTNSIPLDKDLSLGKSWGGYQLRIAIWKCTADVIKKNWFFGVGTGDAQDALQVAYERRKFYFASRYNRYNTHNQYLQETVTNGIFGLIIFLTCLITPLFVKVQPEEKQIYILFIFCFSFACLTDAPLELNKGIIWFSFFNSLIFFKSYNFKYKPING